MNFSPRLKMVAASVHCTLAVGVYAQPASAQQDSSSTPSSDWMTAPDTSSATTFDPASGVVQPQTEEPLVDDRVFAAPVWGAAGSEWVTVTFGGAKDFLHSTDYQLSGGYTTFVVDDIEFTIEGSAWYFDQAGENAFGLSSSMIFRWHFINKQKWSFFADAGIGMMVATDNVPEGGTGFDVLPRFGAGMTMQLDDAGNRFIAGARWHHISNARILGEDRNPSRDGLMLYAGVVFPF